MMLTLPRNPEWLRERIAELPGSAISELQKGPAPMGCRICEILKPLEPAAGPQTGRELLATGCAATDLLDYHAIEGPPGEPAPPSAPPEDRRECYRRCIQIYEAAGWRA